jgi:hypothetical protein
MLRHSGTPVLPELKAPEFYFKPLFARVLHFRLLSPTHRAGHAIARRERSSAILK